MDEMYEELLPYFPDLSPGAFTSMVKEVIGKIMTLKEIGSPYLYVYDHGNHGNLVEIARIGPKPIMDLERTSLEMQQELERVLSRHNQRVVIIVNSAGLSITETRGIHFNYLWETTWN